MSAETNETSTHRPTTGDDRVDVLEHKLDAALDRIGELEETVEEQEQEIDELEERADRAETVAHTAIAQLRNLDSRFGEQKDWTAQQRAELSSRITTLEDPNTGVLGNLRDQIQKEMQTRTQEDAQLKHRIAAVADASDVDIDDSDLVGDDKIQRAMREGAEAVAPRAYAVHERAVSLLRNLDDVGTLTNDSTWGKRFTVKTPQAKSHFRQARNERLTSTETKRVFEKIEEWAGSSPRKVAVDTGGDVNKMTIQTEAGQ